MISRDYYTITVDAEIPGRVMRHSLLEFQIAQSPEEALRLTLDRLRGSGWRIYGAAIEMRRYL